MKLNQSAVSVAIDIADFIISSIFNGQDGTNCANARRMLRNIWILKLWKQKK